MDVFRASAFALLFAATSARADVSPSPPSFATQSARVVLADPDPELRRAVATALAPWRIEIVVDATTPGDDTQAQQRADAESARFVVWRAGGDLIVFDRERGFAEHRGAPVGALDAVSAAAAALTVKTLLRLPPPPEAAVSQAPVAPAPAIAPAHEPSAELRVEAGFATRIARGGSDTELGARFAGAVFVRPWAARGWRFGITADLGTSSDVARVGFKGTWSDNAVLGTASFAIANARWELEPFAAFGVTRSELVGDEMGDVRQDIAMLATMRGGVWVRWRWQMLSAGASLAVQHTSGTPTYTRTGTNVQIFEVPSLGAMLGVVVAADLGR